MKKKLFSKLSILLLLAGGLSLSSCLKDSRFVDFTKVGSIAEFPLGGQVFFGADAITETPANDANGTITRKFSVNIASPSVPTATSNVTLAVDFSIVDKYNAQGGPVIYLPMPANAYKLWVTTIAIPGGQRTYIDSVSFYKNLLDPSKSYMLPIKIASAGGVNISSNMGIHYYHFIGNPFAGGYTQDFSRYNGFSSPPPPGTPKSGGSFSGASTTIYPVTPLQFEVASGYYTGTARYEVTFTQNDPTHFSNFQISMNADDVAGIFVANGISMVQQPVFGFQVSPTYDPTAVYTYAQALSYFTFQYVVQNSSGFRFCVDTYTHN